MIPGPSEESPLVAGHRVEGARTAKAGSLGHQPGQGLALGGCGDSAGQVGALATLTRHQCSAVTPRAASGPPCRSFLCDFIQQPDSAIGRRVEVGGRSGLDH